MQLAHHPIRCEMRFTCNDRLVPCDSQETIAAHIEGSSRKQWRSANDFHGVPMNRPRVPDSREDELAAMNAKLDATILDQDAWEDATDQLGVDRELLGLSQWRSSMLDWVE